MSEARSEKPGFFPLFLDIRNKKLLFIGGGNIAARRIKVLLEFDSTITLVAPKITEELAGLAESGEITYVKDCYREQYLEGADIVFACTADHEINDAVTALCRERGILVNDCSRHEACDFYFPGIVKRNEVVVGVNAGGRAHRKARRIRDKIEEILQDE